MFPYQPHSDTSIEAAALARPKADTLRQQLLKYLKQLGAIGATDEEMQKHFNMNPSTQRPRRVELWRDGWIKDSGRRRNTSSGRSATVWTVV